MTNNEMKQAINTLCEGFEVTPKEVAAELGLEWKSVPNKAVLQAVYNELMEWKEEDKMEEQAQVDLKETKEKIEQATKKEEKKMKKTTEKAGISREELDLVVGTMMDMMEKNTEKMLSTIETLSTRLTEAAKYTKSLEARLAVIENPSNQEVAVTTVLPAPVKEEKKTPAVNKDDVIFTEAQIEALLKVQQAEGEEEMKSFKKTLERINKKMGRTVGGMLENTSEFLDDKGHRGVDSIADIIDTTIDTAKNITLSVVDIAATTLHAGNNIGRSVGHIFINGVVYTLDAAGNIAAAKN